MARAALVVCAIASAAALPVAAAHGATDGVTSGSSFVVRGVVVQYIPPSGSVVGSLSIRVLATSARGQALLGELVTVPVARGKASSASGLLPQKSQCTVTLSARSTGAILKGTAVVKAIVPGGPAADGGSGQPGNIGTPPKVDPDTTAAGNGAAGGGSAGHGQSGDHDSGNGNGGSGHGNGGSGHADDSGSQAHGGAGKSNGHK